MRRLLVGVLLVGLAPGVVAGAQASEGRAPSLPDLPLPPGLAAVRVVDGVPQPRERVVDALAGVDVRDAHALLTALARAVELADPEGEEVVVVSEETPAGFTVPAGDLDGDGRADLLTYAGTELDSLVLTARRGLDGRSLWEHRVGADGLLAFPLGEDLTGDGTADLLVEAFDVVAEETSEDGPAGSTERYTASFTHRLGLLGGQDGREVWRRDGSGSVEQVFRSAADPTGTAYRGSAALQARGLPALPFLSDDVDGDALPDVLLNEVDLDVEREVTVAGALVAAAYDTSSRLRSATRAVVVRGADGAQHLRRGAADQRGLALLLPAGQVVGSPEADLLWSLQEERDASATCVATDLGTACPRDAGAGRLAATTELVDGATGRPAWTSTADGIDLGVRPAGADLDGDGTPELARPLLSPQGGARLQVLSGGSGRPVWEVADELFPADLVAVQDGVAVTVAVDLSGDRLAVLVQRRDAADGRLLSQERREAPETGVGEPTGFGARFESQSLGYGAVPDADGAATGELLVVALAGAVLLDEDFEEVERAEASESAYLPLLGGPAVFEERSQDLRLVLPSGDLDGDGLLDARRDVLLLDGERFAVDSTGLRLRDGQALWQTAEGRSLNGSAADVDGVPGDELVQDLPGVVRSVRGSDLGLRWEAVSRP